MPKGLRKQTRLRTSFRKGERVSCKKHSDMANILSFKKTGLINLDYWKDGKARLREDNVYRLVYRESSNRLAVDKNSYRKILIADMYNSNGDAIVGELEVRRFFVNERSVDRRLQKITLGGAVVYEAPGL